jgi:hypothetical protein
MIRVPCLLQWQICICTNCARTIQRLIVSNAIFSTSTTYMDRPLVARSIDARKASVARAEVPSNEVIVVIRGRRSVFPNVDAPWQLRSMTLYC